MKGFKKGSAIVLTLVFMLGLAGAVKAATAVSLGTADSFAILAGSGITIGGAVNTSTITGDIGSFATPTITGIGNAVLNGINHAGDATTQSAKTDLGLAYTAASQVPSTNLPAGDNQLGSQTLTPGVYDFGGAATANIVGTLTLDGQGDPNAVFIFKASSTLVTAASSVVTLINGAQACNVFWQVGSSATLGAASTFKGNILASVSATLGTTVNVEGRVLAQSGAVVLDGSDVITKATCVGVPPEPAIDGAGGTTGVRYFERLPAINITKIPNPLSLPSGSGSVTYAYTVTNIGQVPMNTVWVKDNKCSSVQYVSGDTNNNSLLNLDETWKYTCTKTVSQTETNTATAHGYGVGLGMDVYDTASATVVVGLPVMPPLIHLVKTANPTVLPAGGGAVTYSYAVTNPGTVPLSNVSITDNKCTGLPGRVTDHLGDVNKNNLLDSGETWQFTCQTNLTQTMTNIGTAEGHANGLTAIDISPATVVVNPPGLPNTGFAPLDGSTSSYILALIVGMVVGVLGSFIILKGRGSLGSMNLV